MGEGTKIKTKHFDKALTLKEVTLICSNNLIEEGVFFIGMSFFCYTDKIFISFVSYPVS